MSQPAEDDYGDDEYYGRNYEIGDYILKCTCPACPEQYDVFTQTKPGVIELVGYLRLRHGYFRADVPYCGGETVYTTNTRGDGIFDEDERIPELTNAIKAIDEWCTNRKKHEQSE